MSSPARFIASLGAFSGTSRRRRRLHSARRTAAAESLEKRALLVAPTLDVSVNPELESIAEDAPEPSGAVGTLVSALIDEGGALNNFADADGDAPGLGITSANLQGGTLWFSRDNGGTWEESAPVADLAPLLLAADSESRVYVQPAEDFHGSLSDAITFRAWDQTQSLSGDFVQAGQDLDGQFPDDHSGSSVSISDDGLTVAIGAPKNSGSFFRAGHVRVYEWNAGAWVQKGLDIEGAAGGDYSGSSIALSSDGNALVIGAPYNDGNGNDSGHARVYRWNGASWNQKGGDIVGEVMLDRAGTSVSIANDGLTVAISSPESSSPDGRPLVGHIRIYDWENPGDGSPGEWRQRGENLYGDAEFDRFGDQISLSEDGSTVAIKKLSAGGVSVYHWDGAAWLRRGPDLAADATPASVVVSADGNRVAVGDEQMGMVRVYDWDGTDWLQRGADIQGRFNNEQFGQSVSFSDDGHILAVGAPGDGVLATGPGRVELFHWDGSGWQSLGSIRGETPGDMSGYSISLSGKGKRLAIGAARNSNPAGPSSGHVRVYDLNIESLLSVDSDTAGITVTPVNDAPTLNPLADLRLESYQTSDYRVSLSGITAGANETQPLRVTASSSDTGVVAVADVNQVAFSQFGSVLLDVAPDAEGSATVTVTVEDGGLDGLLGTKHDNATFEQTFDVNIDSVTPQIVSPTVSTVSQRPRIEWTAVPAAASYRIWISQASQGVNPLIRSTSSDNFFDVPDDLGNGKVDVWVRAVRADGELLPWSQMHRFVVRTAPSLENLVTRQTTAQPTITWDAVPGAVSYDVWLNNASTGEVQHVRTIVTEPEWTPQEDLILSRYQLWVKAYTQDGVGSAWSTRGDFYVAPAPVVISPVQSTFDRTPTFDFGDIAGASSYKLLVRSLNTGATVVDESALPTSDYTRPTSLADGPYVWWACAESDVAGYNSSWSQRQEFYVGGLTNFRNQPAVVNSTTPLVEWFAVTGAVRYEFQVNGVIEGSRFIHEVNLTENSFQIQTPLQIGGVYRAWVRAVSDGQGSGPWSPVYEFTVVTNDFSRVNDAVLVSQLDPLAASSDSELIHVQEGQNQQTHEAADVESLAAVNDAELAAMMMDAETTGGVAMPAITETAAVIPELSEDLLPREWFDMVIEELDV